VAAKNVIPARRVYFKTYVDGVTNYFDNHAATSDRVAGGVIARLSTLPPVRCKQ
jgi:hypothetical protein